MSLLNKSSFQTFNLSEQDTLQGQCLNALQSAVIQNLVSSVAEQILGLEFNPLNPQSFVQNDSFLKGQLAILKYLLETAEQADKTLRELVRQQSSSVEQPINNAYTVFQNISDRKE